MEEVPEEVVEGCSITTSERYLDRYTDMKGLEGYASNTGKWNQCRWASWLAGASWVEGPIAVLYDNNYDSL